MQHKKLKIGLYSLLIIFYLMPVGFGLGTDDIFFYYPFTGNAEDSSTNGYDGTVSGATLTTDRDSNADSAYLLDGDADYIDAEIDSYLSTLDGWTLVYWVYVDDWSDSEVIIGSANSYIENYVGGVGMRYRFKDIYNGADDINTDKFDNDTWVHVALVFSSDDLYVYYDGVENATAAGPGEQSKDITDTRLGARGTDSSLNLDGKIDDVVFYNVSLNSSAILDIYNNGIEITEPTVVEARAVYITPTNPLVNDNLNCNATPYSETDSSDLNVTVNWYINGTELFDVEVEGLNNNTDYVLTDISNNNYTYSDIIKCGVVVTDSTGSSVEVNSTETTIGKPTLTTSDLNVRPENPSTLNNIICNVTITSEIDNNPTAYYNWYINGTIVDSGISTITNNTNTDIDTLSSALTNPSDIIKCGVIANDGYINATEVNSSTITLSVPGLTTTTPEIRPEDPYDFNNIICNTTITSDINITPMAYYSWYINGTVVKTGSIQITNNTNTDIDTLSSAQVNTDDIVKCGVIGYDGFSNITEVNSSTVTIKGNNIAASTPYIYPSTAVTNSNLTCETTITSPANLTVLAAWKWYINGIGVLNGNTTGISNGTTTNITSLSSNYTNENDIVTCSIRPFDVGFGSEINNSINIFASSLAISFRDSDNNLLYNVPIIYTISNSTNTFYSSFGIYQINSTGGTNGGNIVDGDMISANSLTTGQTFESYFYVPLDSGNYSLYMKTGSYHNGANNPDLQLWNTNTDSWTTIIQSNSNLSVGIYRTATYKADIDNSNNYYNGLARIITGGGVYNNLGIFELWATSIDQPQRFNVTDTNSPPTGEVKVIVDDLDLYDQYATSTYYTTFTLPGYITLNTYLLENSETTATLFSVTDALTKSPLSNVRITASIDIGGTSTVIAQGDTDSSGSLLLNLKSNTETNIVATRLGYGTVTLDSITPNAFNNQYGLTMSQNLNLNYSYITNGLSYRFTPLDNIINATKNTTLGVEYNSYNGSISLAIFKIKYNNTILNTINSTSPSGSTLEVNFDPTGRSGDVFTILTLTIDGEEIETQYNYSILLIEPKNWTFADVRHRIDSQTQSTKRFLALGAVILIMATMSGFVASMNFGAGIVMIALYGILFAWGFFTIGQYAAIILIATLFYIMIKVL